MTDFVRLSKVAYEANAPDVIDGEGGKYQLDRSLSDKEKKVYVADSGDVVIAHAGTQLKDKGQRWKDLGSDLAVAFGAERLDPRFRRGERHLKAVESKYGSGNINIVGHSLGGSVAGYLGKKSDRVKNVTTFNRGSSLFSDRGSAKAQNHYTQGDLLSSVGALFNRGTNVITRAKRKNAHSLVNFI